VKRDVLLDTVALVEDSKDSDTLRHRRDPALSGSADGLTTVHRRGGVLLLTTAAACRKRERNDDGRGRPGHAYSGIHGS
jgi:hypothetical protein